MTPKHEDRILLKSKEAAEKLAISQRKLYDLTKKNEITAVRIGRAVRYDLRDLLAWIDYKKNEQLSAVEAAPRKRDD